MNMILFRKWLFAIQFLGVVILSLTVPTMSRAQEFTMAQTLTYQAQATTISFDGLAFFTGTLGSDSFFPPGKVADMWGFQYLRDNDPSRMGHNTDFLTRASDNVLYVLTADERQALVALANAQVDSINQYGYNRFVLIKAFRRLLEGDVPVGSIGLDENAVMAYSSQLYQLDSRMCLQRARVMGSLLSALTPTQKSHLDSMVGKGMLTWPQVQEPSDLGGLEPRIKEAVMTYAGDMFAWYADSQDADVYFCPERQGTYYGGFYLKDAPAVGNPGYSIDTNATAVYGQFFLHILTPPESTLIGNLANIAMPLLYQIVDRRTEVSQQLRKWLSGGEADSVSVMNAMTQYGALDGEIVYNIATNFARVRGMIDSAQMDSLKAARKRLIGDLAPTGAYLYSTPIDMPVIENTDFLFKTYGPNQVKKGWNLISLSHVVSDCSIDNLYPSRTSQAYYFSLDGYHATDTVNNGVGYWMKFGGDQAFIVQGMTLKAETISVRQGWNLFGSIGTTVPITGIVSKTPGLILSGIYGYEERYVEVDSIVPGMGYWAKASTDGQIILGPSAGPMAKNRVCIVRSGEIPPSPPDGEKTNNEIPVDFQLGQNYPNPFNPATVISYQLPVDSKVSLRVFNMLGQNIATLVDGVQQAGNNTATWSASGCASGLYLYRLEALPLSEPTNIFRKEMKMILLK